MLITAGVYALSLAGHVRAAEGARRAAARARRDSGLRASLRAPGADLAPGAATTATSCWLLACGVAYQAGIAVVIALAAVYAEQVLGFKQTQTR